MHIYLGFEYTLLRKNLMLTFRRNRLKQPAREHTQKKTVRASHFSSPRTESFQAFWVNAFRRRIAQTT